MTIDYGQLARQAQERMNRATPDDVPRDRRRDVERPPGPAPAVTATRMLRRGPWTAELFRDAERRYPSVAHTRLLGQHMYLLNDPDAIIDVMLTHGRTTMKGRGLQALKVLLGNGLLTSEGETHLLNRRLVQPAFHRERIAGYARDMVKRAAEHRDAWTDGTTVDVMAEMSALTLSVVGDTLFGIDLTGEANEVREALNVALEAGSGRILLGPKALTVPLPGRKRSLESLGRLDAVVANLIAAHRGAEDSGDILSMLVLAQEDGVGMSDEQIRDEVMTLMLAGHETTATTLAWALLLLSENRQTAAWWREELDEVLADRDPRFDDLSRLPRTRAVVAEAIRLFPPAWIIGRRLLEDRQVGGYTLPRGTIAIASPFALHRSERWWSEPGRFVPSRWLTGAGEFDEAAPGQPRGAWFPFGFGNRRCIGEQFAWTEAVLVLATLGSRWELDRMSADPVELEPNVTLRPGGDVRMVVRSRR